MFEAVVIDREYFDPGALAEAMIYFGRVDLTVDRTSFQRLALAMTPPQLIRALVNGHLHLHFFDAHPAALNLVAADGRPAFSLNFISMSGPGGQVPWETPREVMTESYLRKFGITKANRSFIECVSKYTSFEIGGAQADAGTLDDLANSAILRDLATVYFRKFYTDIDLSDLKFHRELAPNQGVNGSDELLLVADTGFIFDATGEGARPNISNFAIELMGLNTIVKKSAAANTDIWLKPVASDLLNEKIIALKRLHDENSSQIGAFQSVVLDKLSFRQMVNDDLLSFEEILDLIENRDTQQMKAWIVSQKPGRNIVTEYHKAIFAKKPKLSLMQRVVEIVIWEGLSSTVINVLTGGLAAPLKPIISSVANVALNQAKAAGTEAVVKASSGWTPREWVDGVVRPLSGQ
jgi:hypothetical protein